MSTRAHRRDLLLAGGRCGARRRGRAHRPATTSRPRRRRPGGGSPVLGARTVTTARPPSGRGSWTLRAEVGGLLDAAVERARRSSVARTSSIDSGRTLISSSVADRGRPSVRDGHDARRTRGGPTPVGLDRRRAGGSMVPMKSATKRRRGALVELLGRARAARPGRARITAIRSLIVSASSWSWVT